MFFLKDKYTLGYHYGQPTFYNTKHLGQDYICPVGTKVYAPFNGVVTRTFFGADGGYTTWFKPDGQDVTYRFLHLSKQLILGGSQVREGDLMAISGNTGATTTGAHVHFDVFRGSVLPPLVYTNFIDPATINWNPMPSVQRILFIHNNVTDLPQLQVGVGKLIAAVSEASDNQVVIEVDYFKSQAIFSSVSEQTTGGMISTFVSPDGIAGEASVAETQNGKKYMFVCLIYDKTKVTGTQPDTPVHSPTVFGSGFTVFQVPMQAYEGNLGTPCEVFLLHELLHGWYFRINRAIEPDILDMVHPTDQTIVGYQGLISTTLKPYWPLVGGAQGEPMIVIHKLSDKNTKFALSSDMKIGFADFPAYQKFIAGRTVIDVELSDVEFAKIPTSQAVIKS